MLSRERVLTRLGHPGAECDVRHSLVGQTDVLIRNEKSRQHLNTVKRKVGGTAMRSLGYSITAVGALVSLSRSPML